MRSYTLLFTLLVILGSASACSVRRSFCPNRCEYGHYAHARVNRLCRHPYLQNICEVRSCSAKHGQHGFKCAPHPNSLVIRTGYLSSVELVMEYIWNIIPSQPNKRYLNSHIYYFWTVDIEGDRNKTKGATRYVFDLHTAYTTGALTEREILVHADWHTDVNYGPVRYRVYYRRKNDKSELPGSIDLEVHPGNQPPIEATLVAKLHIDIRSLFTSVRVNLVD